MSTSMIPCWGTASDGSPLIAFRLIILYVVLSAGAKLFGFDKRDKAPDDPTR